MTVLAQRAPKVVVAEVFSDLKPVVDAIAARFAKRFNQDMEETKAAAYFHFLEAYHTFNPNRGTCIEQRLNVMVWNRLLDSIRTEAKRGQLLTRADADLDLLERIDPEPFEYDDFCSELGDDARTVVSLLLDTPGELLDMIRRERPSFENPGAPIRRCLSRYISQGLGWAVSRISNAFDELEEVMS